MPLKELNFITSNINKLAEVRAVLGEIVSLKSHSVNLTEIQGTIEEISKDKCRRAAVVVGLMSLHLGSQVLTTGYGQGGRASLDGGHMPLFQRSKGAAWALHV